eukprot:scaffold404496_cov17-Prasinocladus_malaysianus.AAC.1
MKAARSRSDGRYQPRSHCATLASQTISDLDGAQIEVRLSLRWYLSRGQIEVSRGKDRAS